MSEQDDFPHFREAVNQRCRLPGLSDQEYFALWHASVSLVAGISGIRRLFGRVNTRELVSLVGALSLGDAETAHNCERAVRSVMQSEAYRRSAQRRKIKQRG